MTKRVRIFHVLNELKNSIFRIMLFHNFIFKTDEFDTWRTIHKCCSVKVLSLSSYAQNIVKTRAWVKENDGNSQSNKY